MREELDKRLVEKYPLLFRDRYAPMNETAMCWGFSCGDGWYSLIDTLCWHLTSYYNHCKQRYEDYKGYYETTGKLPWRGGRDITAEEVEELRLKMVEAEAEVPTVAQVKEKFGTLRFYVDRATEKHYDYINFAENMSSRICEKCGAADESVRTWHMGWHTTLCKTHAIEQYGAEEVEDYLNPSEEDEENE